MQFLIDFAAEDREFQEILRRASEFDTVQGVVLDVDRYWLGLWLLRERWGEERLDRWFSGYLEAIHQPWRDFGSEWSWGLPKEPSIFHRPLGAADVHNWRPLNWEYRLSRFGLPKEGLPLVVKVCLRPQASSEDRFPKLEQLQEDGGRLQVELETRSRARLSSDPRRAHVPLPGGVSIGVGATDYGTLGVVLTDGAGVYYGLTCSHVAGLGAQVVQPSIRDATSAIVIGRTVAATALTACPPGTKCNPWSGATPNEIDASLIQIDTNRVGVILEVLDIGPLTGVMPRASISTSQSVEVMGRTSKLNALQIGGLAAWYTFVHDGSAYCFRNLFEVESPYGTAGIIKLGDSGAPVCTPDDVGMAWAGMIVGCDAYKGYAMYGETVDKWTAGQGYALRVT